MNIDRAARATFDARKQLGDMPTGRIQEVDCESPIKPEKAGDIPQKDSPNDCEASSSSSCSQKRHLKRASKLDQSKVPGRVLDNYREYKDERGVVTMVRWTPRRKKEEETNDNPKPTNTFTRTDGGE